MACNEWYSLAFRFGDRALVLRGGEETNVRELPHGHFDSLHRSVTAVRYVHVHGDVLAVVVQLLVQRRLQMKLVRRHDELFAHLDGRLFALLRRRVHDLSYRQPHRASTTHTIRWFIIVNWFANRLPTLRRSMSRDLLWDKQRDLDNSFFFSFFTRDDKIYVCRNLTSFSKL